MTVRKPEIAFYCEGCGDFVERKANIGRRPKPPFCRSCSEKSRLWFVTLERARRTEACKICDNEIPHRRGLVRYCSDQCADAGKIVWLGQYRERKEAVLHRDGWKCRACGVDTPRELRGTRDSNAPHVDHIIPRCQNGSDTDANKQCLCLRCNISKNGRTMVFDVYPGNSFSGHIWSGVRISRIEERALIDIHSNEYIAPTI